MKYARGLHSFLLDAIHAHKKENGGKLPRQIQLHPIVYDEFCYFFRNSTTFKSTENDRSMVWYGVEIVKCHSASFPFLITHDKKAILL